MAELQELKLFKTIQEVYNLIAQGKNSKEISNRLNISLRTAQTYIKEFKEVQNANAKKTQNASDRKKRKTVARSLIISGESLKDVAEKIGTPK